MCRKIANFIKNIMIMISVTEIVKEGILEISFSESAATSKNYLIKNMNEEVVLKGKITGSTQRSCLYIGQLMPGNYQIIINELTPIKFTVV